MEEKEFNTQENLDINLNDIIVPEENIAPPEDDIVKVIKNQKKTGKHEQKKKGLLKSVVWVLVIFSLSVFLAASVIIFTGEYLGIGPGRGKEIVVEIEKGMSTRQIAARLEESGAINNSFAFLIYSKLKGNTAKYSYGVYVFNNEIGYNDLAEILMTQGARAETKNVVIPEGTGINDYTKNVNGEKVTIPGIATILENAGVCNKEDFFEALREIGTESELLVGAETEKTYYALEGYLFPDTYNFYVYDSKECARLAVRRMLNECEERFTGDLREVAKNKGYTINQIMTMASIVQMESGGNLAEAPNVAAVFYNRLASKDFSTLGSSPTCYYGNSFKYDDGRYDTYTAKGLPPGPLCSPGIDAIKAALNPTEDFPYYYFVSDKNGKFYYHKSYAEQNTTIDRLKRENKWIYEYFD